MSYARCTLLQGTRLLRWPKAILHTFKYSTSFEIMNNKINLCKELVNLFNNYQHSL